MAVSTSRWHVPRTRDGIRVLFGAVVVLSALALAGNAAAATKTSGGGAHRSAAKLFQIREVQNVTTGLFAAANYAQTLGLFKAHGLDVQQIVTPGLIPTLLASGQADIAIAGNPATYAAIVKGLPAKLIAVPSNGYGFIFAVNAHSNITSFEDLRGKTIGITSVGSASDYVTQQLSAKLGGSLKLAPVGNLPALAAALSNGSIDGFMFEPSGIIPLQESGAVRILGSVEKYLGGGTGAGVGIVATKDLIQKHPKAVRDYLKSYFLAQRKLLDNSAKALLYLQQLLNVSVHTAGSSYSVYRTLWTREGVPGPGALAGTSKAISFIDKTITSPPPPSAYYDKRFVPARGK